MVKVVNATGIASGATTAIDLSDYLKDDVARLVGVRTISRATQVGLAFAGVAVAAHTHNVEAEAAHTHNVTAEAAHSHAVEAEAAHMHAVEAEAAHIHDAGFSLQADAAGLAGHSHTGGQPSPAGGAFSPTVAVAGAFTPTVNAAGVYAPTVNAAGAFTPTVNAGGGHTPTGVVPVPGLVHTDLAVQAGGLMDATYLTPGPGSVALTGRKAIMMGDALASNAFLELRVLYMRECAGIF